MSSTVRALCSAPCPTLSCPSFPFLALFLVFFLFPSSLPLSHLIPYLLSKSRLQNCIPLQDSHHC